MNNQFSKKVSRRAVFTILASLAVMAPFAITFATNSTSAIRQQGRGRIIKTAQQSEAQSTQPSDAPQIVLDQESEAALDQIIKSGRNVNSINNIIETKTLRLDIAENGKKFTPDETPAFPDGLPAYGAEFITEGYIYPGGTLSGANGVNPDGSPEFPNKVIGRWFCRGWHVGEGAHTTKGPWVVTHQLFDFGSQAGRSTIATDGFELPEENAPILRAITGGTGAHSLARGEARQVFLGFNQSNGVSLQQEIKVMVR